MRRDMKTRRFSFLEAIVYITVLALLFGLATIVQSHPLPVFLISIPIAGLIAAPIGLVIGGREWFRRAALLGVVAWLVVDIRVPMVVPVIIRCRFKACPIPRFHDVLHVQQAPSNRQSEHADLRHVAHCPRHESQT